MEKYNILSGFENSGHVIKINWFIHDHINTKIHLKQIVNMIRFQSNKDKTATLFLF